MLLLAVIMGGICSFVIFLICGQLFFGESRRMNLRLENYLRQAERRHQEKTIHGGVGGAVSGWRLLMQTISRPLSRLSVMSFLERQLIRAGWSLRGSEFVLFSLGLSVLIFMLVLIIAGVFFLSLLMGLGGLILPGVWLRRKTELRLKAFNEQLGDALVLAANSLRTGYSFFQALEMVAKEMPAPIADEFGGLLKEMSLGVPTESALQNLARRINSDDLDLVITAVLIQRQVGGNLAEVLDSIAATIRERVRIKGQIRTLTAQGRISGLVVGLLPVVIGLVIYLMNPGYLTVLFTHPVGKAMLFGGVASQIAGVLLIRRIVNIEV